MEKRFGLLGRKLGHSWSPQIHAQLCGYPYDLHEVEPEELESFLTATDLAGMNVTIPYKKSVLPFCSSLSPAARAIGSVNTLVRTPAGWHGDNTDYDGFLAMAASCGVPFTGKKALVFGTGGASLAVLAALRALGADPIVNISRSGPENYGTLDRHRDARILVNATPLGMYPDTGVSPVELDRFPACEALLDVVYNPIRTKLLMDAEARGIPCRGGLLMLVAQAKRAAELFAGCSLPDELIPSIADRLEKQMGNIILIGMPGCGKTTVGRILSRRLGRPFFDADELIAERAQKSIPEIFSTEGEEGFRQRETAVLAELGKGSGAVIATGGGCVTRRENYPLLHQNGTLIWIRRELSLLPTDGRPLSEQNSPQTLYARRKAQYAAFADAAVDSDEVVEHTVQKILEVIA